MPSDQNWEGGEKSEQLAPVVTADEFNEEAENAVADKVYGHVMTELLLEQQIRADGEQDEQERRLIELSRVYRLGQPLGI